ncbi:Phage tail sheath protein [Desulfosporosinus acidiphilus SJ4]|uniref:Phage tail sheath protein n=1 Tax=Desulfosporosinus acidiphilus (strain DSM 22704 / JCM 16185 / SJ4) TaxID=646529 RepID=I4D3F9_DESAJ|nr:phage tail sheath subtilisin-like domain-containing protein [Desulfosporosinus acidiphilus]AFM40333.1 Phage tail sheath protein [Desulfosporosinus acidiphilus SJ4]
MGLPDIEVIFKSLAVSAITRGAQGIVALVLKDSVHNGSNIYTDPTNIPKDYSAYNLNQINLAFQGGVQTPTSLIVYVEPSDAADYTAAMNYLETVKWDYGAVPGISSTDAQTVATWLKALRDTKDIKAKMVLPNTAADHEGIINFATDGIVLSSGTVNATDYCSRIAGILAGTPLTMSATFQVLPEVIDVPHNSKTQFDTLINEGQLVFMNDGEKVKIARAINSLVTLTPTKTADWQKCKIVDIMDLQHNDIIQTFNDNYVGKVPNDYDHKCLLITAINAYLEGLENQMLLDPGKNKVSLDVEAQTLYLQSKGIDTSTMSQLDIKKANTGSLVFLTGTDRPLDAMEDLTLNLYLN